LPNQIMPLCRSRRIPSSASGGGALIRRLAGAAVLATALSIGVVGAQAPAPLSTHVTNLSSLDYATRMNAARAIRRLPPEQAVPALTEAVRKHDDEFVRYRAFVVLSSFNDRGTVDLARGLLRGANDRLREVAYKWLEVHPDPALVPALLGALQTETAEFVRPAVVSALAVIGDDMRVQRALLGEIGRGLDFFRSAVIEALGRRHAAYALDGIAAVAKLQGPLQSDSVTAVGRIGGPRALALLTSLAAESPAPSLALTLRAARCVAGESCDAAIEAISSAVREPSASAAVLRAGIGGLTSIAGGGNQAATAALVGLGSRGGVLRDQAAIGLGTIAVMDPDSMIAWLDRAPQASREAAIALIKDGFDDLEEDFGEEQFFAAARAAYWKAAEGSDTRSLAALLIQRLEF
jgi:HEAT repeat protein